MLLLLNTEDERREEMIQEERQSYRKLKRARVGFTTTDIQYASESDEIKIRMTH